MVLNFMLHYLSTPFGEHDMLYESDYFSDETFMNLHSFVAIDIGCNTQLTISVNVICMKAI